MKETLLARYLLTSAAARYYVGFVLNGVVYLAKLETLSADMVKLDRESRKNGGALKLRLTLDNDQKSMLINLGAEVLGTEKTIFGGVKNKGTRFESYIAERFNGETRKAGTPYYKAGDMNIMGLEVQVKFQRASLANENTIRKAEGLPA